MASASELDRVTMVVLRYLRKPMFVLVLVYAIGITGMALIPGQTINGESQYMSLFHAFYFLTYTATTTGFGEIPGDFSDEQRLWAIVCLYMGVVAWLYAIGSMIRLLQNPHFVQALNEYRFARLVRQISEPYFIVCGFGDTGSLLARGLSDHYLGAVVLDSDPERVKALALRDYSVKMPALCADASVPKHLVDAGVRNKNCKAVVVLTGDEDINLKIAVMTRLLNSDVKIVCRTSSARHQEHLKSLESVAVIDPFEIFAQLLGMAITTPLLHNLNSWLVRARDVRLGHPLQMPAGRWILCGYGRMGRWLHEYFTLQGVQTCIIDPDSEQAIGAEQIVNSHADHVTLREAGIEHAAGIVAGTNDDSHNLSILMSTRSLNPQAFVIVRQNYHENQLAFDSSQANYILQTSLTTARRILKLLISPLAQTFIDRLHELDGHHTETIVRRLQKAVGEETPHLWRVNLCRDEAIAVDECFEAGNTLKLGDLVRDPHDLDGSLHCVALVIKRTDSQLLTPANEEVVQRFDEILFCGSERSKVLLAATLNNPQTLQYLLTGNDMPRGYFFAWLARRP